MLWAMGVHPPSWLPAFWGNCPLGVGTRLWDTRASVRSDVGIWLTFTAFQLISNVFSEVQVCAYSLHAVCMWRASLVLHGWQNQRKRRKENKENFPEEIYSAEWSEEKQVSAAVGTWERVQIIYLEYCKKSDGISTGRALHINSYLSVPALI